MRITQISKIYSTTKDGNREVVEMKVYDVSKKFMYSNSGAAVSCADVGMNGTPDAVSTSCRPPYTEKD